MQFTLGGKSPQGWLRNVQNMKTPYNKLGDTNFLE